DEAMRGGAERGRVVGESVNFTRDLANEPGAYMTPTIMAERAQEIANEFGLEIDVLDQARMEEEGMGALLSVARGSDQPPKMMVLTYMPEGKQSIGDGEDFLALVGKGITFDTGGISIKPSENMELMKYDMTGGATVLGVMRAVAQLKPSIPVLGVVPSTENMPSGKATKPGDVVRAMTGKTIEVINTDAEGRLILADAVSYAKKLGATRVIDMATLTGAVSIALGDVNTGILGTDQQLIDEVIESGREVGEKFWQLPLDKEYSKQIKSDIADIKNVGGRKAGTITAAAFIKEFADGISWAHLDIAGTAWGDEAKPFRSKGPTGVAVRTLLNFVAREAARATGAKDDGGKTK
ncbi:MAG TPA: leucyl aminopeptidase, partial [Pyrinomonadaceae bacterium]